MPHSNGVAPHADPPTAPIVSLTAILASLIDARPEMQVGVIFQHAVMVHFGGWIYEIQVKRLSTMGADETVDIAPSDSALTPIDPTD